MKAAAVSQTEASKSQALTGSRQAQESVRQQVNPTWQLFTLGAQAKLAVSSPDDPSEREADVVAEQVMRKSARPMSLQPQAEARHDAYTLQRKCSACDEEKEEQQIQRKATNDDASSVPGSAVQWLNAPGSGTPLDDNVRQSIEPTLNADLSSVRVHTDGRANDAAAGINARAFTYRNNIFLGSGESSRDLSLMAHESTHVVQQTGMVSPLVQRRVVMRSITPTMTNIWPIGSVQTGTTENLRPLTDTEIETYIRDIGTAYHDFDEIINGTGQEFDFVADPAYRRGLIVSIIRNLQRVTTDLFFDDYPEFVREVKKRALISLFMRASQGRSSATRPTGYPRSCGSDPGPRVSQAAQTYWTVHPSTSVDHYWFELTAQGTHNGFEALRTLIFNHQSDACLRTLMHCDYMISAQQFFVMANAMGATDFNSSVSDGSIHLEVRWNSYENIVADTATSPGLLQSLQEVSLSSENDFIIGDHAMFYNHDAFDDMNRVYANVNGVASNWRLENAIITDTDPSGEFRFQGHGYFTPKRRSAFVTDMVGKMNELVTAARSAIASGHTSQLGFTYSDGSRFDVVRPDGASWRIYYHEGLGVDQSLNVASLPLRTFSTTDFPNPFVSPGATSIMVRRPIESRRESLGPSYSSSSGSVSPLPVPTSGSGTGSSATPSTTAPPVGPSSSSSPPVTPATPVPTSGGTTTSAGPACDTRVPSDQDRQRQQNQGSQQDPIILPPVDCDDSSTSMDCEHPTTAANLTQFAFLVRCLESVLATTHGPVDILRTLRELYYGGERFDAAACGDSESSTISTLNTTSPALMTALHASKVTSGVDVGHIFTGLEAMLCPRTSTDVAWYAPTVDMSNEDFMTWGGDIGSAAAGRLQGYNDSGIIFKDDPPWSTYFLTTGSLASREDLTGDIDSFVIRANLRGVPCSSTKDTRMPSPSTPISSLLISFYDTSAAASTGLTASDRFDCFANAIGASISSRSITNKSVLIDRYSPQVYSFAHLFYLGMSKWHLVTMDMVDVIKLLEYSEEITSEFIDWVEKNLT